MRFNFLKKAEKTILNREGAEAYTLTPEMELYTAVATAGLSDTYYEAADARLARIKELIPGVPALFVAQLAIYARVVMHMRSVPLVLVVELAKKETPNGLVARTVTKVVKRADEITELLACYEVANSRTGAKKLNKLSKQLQRGLASAFNNFDEYQFAKYNRDGRIALRDALFLVHPKPKDDKQQAIFNKIATQTLDTPYTWETELSAAGAVKYATEAEQQAAIKATWEGLVKSGRMGYMATLRNLRNLINADISATDMQAVCHYLALPSAVANAKQLPFRYLAAYWEVKGLSSPYVPMVLDCLEKAIQASAQNIAGFGINTTVLVACDVSGSMQRPVSPKSTVQLYDIGLMLAMLLQSKCKRVITGMFGDTWKVIAMPTTQILANVLEYRRREGEVGYATNGYLVIDDLLSRRVKVDKIMIFTDGQMWDNAAAGNSLQQSWWRYLQMVPGAKLYLFDIAGNGTMPLRINDRNVFLISGWSDKIFDVLSALERGEDALGEIQGIDLE